MRVVNIRGCPTAYVYYTTLTAKSTHRKSQTILYYRKTCLDNNKLDTWWCHDFVCTSVLRCRRCYYCFVIRYYVLYGPRGRA